VGLDTSHDCWHGPYSMFMRWRKWVAERAGYPPLELMYGFQCPLREELRAGPKFSPTYDLCPGQWFHVARQFPAGIPWGPYEHDPLSILLSHSDSSGRIKWFECRRIAIRLGHVLRGAPDGPRNPKMPERAIYDGERPATLRFIRGLLDAYNRREDVIFH